MWRILLFTPLILLAAPSQEALWQEPWGKDAALVAATEYGAQPCQPNLLARGGNLLIRFHQEVISPIDGPRSHYQPSSSQYTKEAISKYGFFKGVMMGCDRLMRENKDPWVYPIVVSEDGRILKVDTP